MIRQTRLDIYYAITLIRALFVFTLIVIALADDSS